VIKRIFDVSLSLILLPVFMLLMLIISILVYIKMGYPIIYSQKRVGFKNQIFTIYKFRTMLIKEDDSGFDDKKRLVPFGRLLRKTSLDELPEIFNILQGSMSWVGPRPLLVEYLKLYNNEQIKRHDVLPGLTGWAQIKGRNLQSWEERFKLDLEYVKKQSLIFDLWIIIKTIEVVFGAKGAESSENTTMKPFMGSNK
jgi:sugar transferase EpsL